ncbi:MAG: hypothetical protein HXY40_05735 [Chloroflexi bacterium]|nr:hypothetical protein [Chloroflexota bacterium]
MPFSHFSSDPEVIRRRLRARLTLAEFAALCFQVALLLVFVSFHAQNLYPPHDYDNYTNTLYGNFSLYYYAYWFLPIFGFLERLPGEAGYILWSLANIAAIFFAARVFGGTGALALFSYQMIYTLFYGQITGILVGGLALCWWGMANRRYHLAGLGLLIACTKYQLGLPLGLALWLLSDLSWRERARVLIVPAVIALMSLVIYPLWPLAVLNTVRSNPPNNDGSLSVWRWLGAAALVFWLPPLLLRLPRERRFVALAAAAALALPYYQQADLLALYVLPVGWLPLLGNLGYLYPVFGWGALQGLWIIPAIAYLMALGLPLLRRFVAPVTPPPVS